MAKDSSIADVLIVGAGMAGATAAFVLSRMGVDVVLLDSTLMQSPVFKAEKIEPDQAELLRELNLMDVVMPECSRINRIACGQGGRIWRFTEIEEYGCFYHDMVNAVRRAMPDSVRRRTARAVRMQTGSQIQEVELADGTVVKARLLVLASGALGKLFEQLGLHRRTWSAAHSVSLGFSLQSSSQLPGGAESVTYREKDAESGIDYITLFPIKNLLRANMFTYWDAKDQRIQKMRTHGIEALIKFMPQLTSVTGPLVLSSKVEAVPIHLYRVEGAVRPGVVLLGDVFQSVCPATGTGLSKVFVDVRTLAQLVPAWLQTPGMGVEKIARYYHHEEKHVTDEHSLTDALYRKRLCSDRSIAWRARRWKKYFPRWLAGVRYPGGFSSANASQVPAD